MDPRAWIALAALAFTIIATVLGLLVRWAWRDIKREIRSTKTFEDVDSLRKAVDELRKDVHHVRTDVFRLRSREFARVVSLVQTQEAHLGGMNDLLANFSDQLGEFKVFIDARVTDIALTARAEIHAAEQRIAHLEHGVHEIREYGCGLMGAPGNGKGAACEDR